MEIKLNSDDNLPLNKTLRLHNLTIVVRSAFQNDKKVLYLKYYNIKVLCYIKVL